MVKDNDYGQIQFPKIVARTKDFNYCQGKLTVIVKRHFQIVSRKMVSDKSEALQLRNYSMYNKGQGLQSKTISMVYVTFQKNSIDSKNNNQELWLKIMARSSDHSRDNS